jgi:hypothetical protein
METLGISAGLQTLVGETRLELFRVKAIDAEHEVRNGSRLRIHPQHQHAVADPDGLIAASHVISVEFAMIAAADNY